MCEYLPDCVADDVVDDIVDFVDGRVVDVNYNYCTFFSLCCYLALFHKTNKKFDFENTRK